MQGFLPLPHNPTNTLDLLLAKVNQLVFPLDKKMHKQHSIGSLLGREIKKGLDFKVQNKMEVSVGKSGTQKTKDHFFKSKAKNYSWSTFTLKNKTIKDNPQLPVNCIYRVKTGAHRLPTMYMRMSRIITMAVWWSFQAWFKVCRKLLFRAFRTSSRTWNEKQIDKLLKINEDIIRLNSNQSPNNKC